MGLIENYDNALINIKQTLQKTGHNAQKPQILLVTKYANAQDIATLLAARKVQNIGESRLQDSLKKWSSPQLKDFGVTKFFIGHLQTNKAAKVLQNFDVICSLDSIKLAEVIDKQAAKTAKAAVCLVQVKLTDIDAQGGVSLDDAQALITEVKTKFKHINLKGIMAIAPIAAEDILRPLFKRCKQIFDANFSQADGDYLSLGMSGDYITATQEGSNLPRLGSGIFEGRAV